MGEPPTLLAARIRDLRLLADWNQSDLAARVRTSACRVSDWELGMVEPTLPLLQRIAGAFDMTVSQLLDGVM
jgi:transcriptional regulator with XRE-family HTH domain